MKPRSLARIKPMLNIPELAVSFIFLLSYDQKGNDQSNLMRGSRVLPLPV